MDGVKSQALLNIDKQTNNVGVVFAYSNDSGWGRMKGFAQGKESSKSALVHTLHLCTIVCITEILPLVELRAVEAIVRPVGDIKGCEMEVWYNFLIGFFNNDHTNILTECISTGSTKVSRAVSE